MPSLVVVVPTYNEVANVAIVLPRIAAAAGRNPDFRMSVAVVDDNSPDGTAERARELADELGSDTFEIFVLTREKKEGLGAAYIWAFQQLLDSERQYDYLLQMDADLSHNPDYIDVFLREVRAGADFVVASRYIPGGGTPDWTLDRKILSGGGNFYTRIFLGSKITDWTGGFNLFSTALLRRLGLDTIRAAGYGFQIVLKSRALRESRSMKEIPIVFLDRTIGSSKIPGDTLVRNLFLVLQVRFSRQKK
ncbi:polyprenol monophosphomannose synthase [Rathayibacter toxicus]|uniref:Glycosyl transferase n=1 Tax=Rathayibacter toxicus TaxID=145458 RepID=A0A0C5BAY3_9MICO|nr:polyprenol monophosphomannose synthase [Rathayibacter toxicus]AJM78018.1 glycosyl transferase [Rathayibacter toxicus]ALS57756.1 glycosyl transferase [Rathayibacter toxicus]KKM47336.1 glycosyl transferase [Rathayibacter toxicus]PPG20572.1 polyprenol monophosphomannose synthase [Rathayibacter toxicus]PPG45674.1 polyprenol monophosphomannose synthase [Rathayibacter toxicus]